MRPLRRLRWTPVFLIGFLLIGTFQTRRAFGQIPERDQELQTPACVPWFCATPDLESAHRFNLRARSRDELPVQEWTPGFNLGSNSEPVVVDILVAYSSAAAAAQGNGEALRQLILRCIDSANEIYSSSEVAVRLNPVYIGPLDWNESGSLPTDWDVLRASGSTIRTLRNDYKADLACLVIESDKFGISGVANQPGADGDPELSLCLIRRTGLIGEPKIESVAHGVTLPHEFSHLLGAGHDHRAPASTGIPGAFPFSAAHRFLAHEVTYTTVMSYPPGTPVAFFSNPRLSYDGTPLGVPADQESPADNVQTMNRLAPKVAQYRTARSRIGFSSRHWSAREEEGRTVVRLQRTGDLNTATRVRLGVRSTGTAKPGADFTPPSSTILPFTTNQSTAEIVLDILHDDVLEGDETVELLLSGVGGDHGLGENASATITIRDAEPSFIVEPGELRLKEGHAFREASIKYIGSLGPDEVREIKVRTGGANDTALDETDVEITPRHLVFTDSRRSHILRIRALPDAIPEPDETLRVILGDATLVIHIIDGDRPGSLLPISAADNSVGALLPMSDGGMMVGGDFTHLGDKAITLAWLDREGMPRPDFHAPELRSSTVAYPGMFPARINCLVRDSADRILVGGFLGVADRRPAHSLIRLHSTGRRDDGFKACSFDGGVFCVVEQSDGKLLVGGDFEGADGIPAPGFARLNGDGSLDGNFPGLSDSKGRIETLARLPDGRILAGGFLESFHGRPVRRIARFLADGSFDITFPLLKSGASGRVKVIAALPDGRAYIGGLFDQLGGRPYPRLGRLLPDGSVDPSFKAPKPNGEINSILPLPNGQFLAGGAFTRIGNEPRRFIALLNEDGTADTTTFDMGAGAGDHVWALAAGGDGSLFVGGAFKTFNDQTSPGLARLRLPSLPGTLLGVRRLPGSAVEARITGLVGVVYSIESSPDLTTWEPEAEVRINQPDNTASLRISTEQPARYLRLSTKP